MGRAAKNYPFVGLGRGDNHVIIRGMTGICFRRARGKIRGLLWAVLAMLNLTALALGDIVPRERLLMDFGWKFHLGDEWGLNENLAKAGQSDGPAALKFNDTTWREVNLPHDWAVELPFDKHANYDHGYKPLGPGYSTNSIAWYRREFTLPSEDHHKHLWIEFAGVYRDCRVFLNGFLLAHHESGYNSFRCDITDVANYGGKNVVAVRVDASEFEGWFYEGAGIYRHVWLVKTAPLAVAPDGVFVYSTFPGNMPGANATVHFETQVFSTSIGAANANVTWEIFAPGGNKVAKTRAAIEWKPRSTLPRRSATVEQSTEVASPILWSPESPALYRLVTTVASGGQIVDRVETEFGIRTVGFDPTNGFLLNGRHYEIKGTCNHQDHAGLGTALPDALQDFRVRKLKEMGCNATRTSHNEPTPELLEACDRLGMLVMDENRRLGSDPATLANLEEQIRRDRNHPSVFIWSLANEEYVQRSGNGARIFATMQNFVHQLDPTRLCTAAMNGWSSHGEPDGFSIVMDVQGFNYYHIDDMDAYHRRNPAKPCIGTEEASTFTTRGIYADTSTYKSAYDKSKPDWYGALAEEWWAFYAARPWASGSFVWTGFDYRGEASPFHWPNISSEFGVFDTCGFPKDLFYYYQSWWTDKPVLHLLPHWNWPGREGQEIGVWAFSNCEEVELFLNGQSLGRKNMPRNSHLQWNVQYAPGALSAKGYNGGKLVGETKVETAGAPAEIQLTPDRVKIHADGEDCSVVTVSIVDSQGRIVPTVNNLVHFELIGPGRIIGVGNGDPACHEPDVYPEQRQFRSVPLDGWRMTKVADVKHRPETAANFDDTAWPPVDVRAASGPLKEGESAVYRTHFSATERDLAAPHINVQFGMIDDDGWIYVNGRRAGQSHDWESDPIFNIRPFLQVGENTLAVMVKNGDGTGGVNKGASLELQEMPDRSPWQRGVFNGLAQVIVQADADAGPIQLRATSDGLAPAVITIDSEPYPALPILP